MSGRQVYISRRHHHKLKMASMQSDKDMGELVEEFIDGLDVAGWEEVEEVQYA